MAASWFIERQGKETGPYSGQQLKELAASGKLRRTDLVRRQDQPKAVPAERVNGLFPSGDGKAQTVPPPIPVGTPAKFGPQPGPAPARTPSDRPVGAVQPVPTPPPPPAAIPLRNSLIQRFSRMSLVAKVLTVIGLVAAGSFMFSCGAGVLMHMAGVTPKGSASTGGQAAGDPAKETKAAGGVTIIHKPYTQIKMPALPEARTHRLDKNPDVKGVVDPAGLVPIKDIASIDFLHGPNGEEVHMETVAFQESEKMSKDIKVPHYQRYYYMTKDGQRVYHGPYTQWGPMGGRTDEWYYVYGVRKFAQGWDFLTGKGEQQSTLEVYRGDEDHTGEKHLYFDNGDLREVYTYRVRHNVGPADDKLDYRNQGLRLVFWDNTNVRGAIKRGVPGAEGYLGTINLKEQWEDGRLVGRVVYDRQGKVLASEGTLNK